MLKTTMAEPTITPQRMNSLTDVIEGVASSPYQSQTISLPFTLAQANSYTPLTLNRILLSYSYMSQGLVQTVIKQPVDDAFRGGIEISSAELDEKEMAELTRALHRSRKRGKFTRNINPNAAIYQNNSDMASVKDTLCWARLYGGAGLIVNTDQDFRTPLNIEKVRKDSPLEFISADRWELILSQTNIWDESNSTPFNFYGLPLNRTRVIKVLGVEAPSYIRMRLQGWGMSEIERCIRAINSFVKFESLIFELLDEAKIDVYKIQGFNDSLLTDEGTARATQRVQLGNRLKNYQNALAMDSEDDYTQKQITWSGLAEIWNELRLNLSSALKIPMNKLFGQSATGFGGGQDALENYNSIVESIRDNAEPLLSTVIDLRCQQMFGFVPEYEVKWKPLKVLDGLQEEQVKTQKQTRIMEQFRERLLTGVEASRILRSEGLLSIETEVSKGLRDVEPMAVLEMEQAKAQADFKQSEKKE
jgi:uncharacterized protein